MTKSAPAAEVDPLPWHREPWARLMARVVADRLPHALLLTGPVGVGKRRLAERLARALLCARARPRPPADIDTEAEPQMGGDACGECRACHLLAAGTHPDRIDVVPQKPEQPVIRIDQIRALTEFLSLSSQLGGRRVAVVDPADGMNAAAANALLKTLEEPSHGVVLVLLADRPARLPATVRSRCQIERVAAPGAALARRWLETSGGADALPLLGLTGNAPLAAQRLAENDAGSLYGSLLDDLIAVRDGREDPVAAAARWSERGLGTIMGLLQPLVAELIRLRWRRDESLSPEAPRLRALGETLDLTLLFDYMDRLTALARAAGQPLNEPLAVEDVFIQWHRLAATT